MTARTCCSTLAALGLLAPCPPAQGTAQPARPADERGAAEGWSQWRGPLATGEAPDSDPPVEWSEERNVRWKLPLPGAGHSTPVVRGERIFLTSAIPVGEPVEPRPETAPGAHDNAPVTHRQSFVVLAVRRSDGEVLWQRAVCEALPHETIHVSGTFASASPVTDGELVFASFGSNGIYALDVEGELVWEKDLGDMRVKHAHGEGSSPVLHGDTLVVNWDHEGPSFVVALDKHTGRELWRVPRDEPTSWATPIVVPGDEGEQVVVSGSNRVRGYDLATGEVVWECGGLSRNVVASPVFADGVVYAGSSYDTQALLAIRVAGAKGDVTRTENVLWARRAGTPYVPSPLLLGGTLWFLRHYQNVLYRVDAATGDEVGRALRLDGLGNVYASPVAAAGRVYLSDLAGATLVLSATSPPRALALNHLDDAFSASPAIAGDALYLRGARSLYCIAEE